VIARRGLGALAWACACSSTPAQPLPPVPPQDYADSGVPFDKNDVVPSSSFTDFMALGASDVQSFLEHDPYTGVSFLATYQSNGIVFSAAVERAAVTYRVNPIVLLVEVEATLGLVSDTVYPQPASDVDYLFGCGCGVPTDPTTCDPAMAGLDLQLGCYANALRTSLEQVATNAQTAGGWGPGLTSTSIDGVSVTPADDSTAALYQWDPVVGTGRSGSSLFENIWSEFTSALSYGGPEGTSSGAVALIGDGCVSAADCAIEDAVCATGTQYPGGMCTSKCTNSCPGTGAFCASFSQGGFCLALCNTTVPDSCRKGYSCVLVQSAAGTQFAAQYVCTPE
jgi:hypothetical protein